MQFLHARRVAADAKRPLASTGSCVRGARRLSEATLADWFFTSDLHGQGALYEQLLGMAAARRPRVVLIGGDLSPHDASGNGVASQRVFLAGFFTEFARRLREAVPDCELLVLMGNDDWAANVDLLEHGDGDLWRFLHGRRVEVDGVRVAGLSWVPITPFSLKDWERWDDGGEPSARARLSGVTSRGGGVVRCDFDPARRAPTIGDALDELARTASAPGSTIFVCHTPPWGTRCDMIGAEAHVGSRALRAFVERHQPPLVLSGHIHESARVSAAWRDAIGRTVVVNPGQFGGSRLCGVWFDPADPGATLRHTVHG